MALRKSHVVSSMLLLSAWLVLPTTVLSDEYDDVDRLRNSFWELYESSSYGEAAPIARKMIEIGQRYWNSDQDLITYGWQCLAYLHMANGKLSDAEELCRQIVDVRRRALGEDDGMYGFAMSDLALVYRWQGRLAESEQLYRQAIDVMHQAWGEDDEDALATRVDLAQVLFFQGKFEQAADLYEKALAVYERLFDAEILELRPLLLGLAEVHRAQDRYRDAEQTCLRVVRMAEEQFHADHVEAAFALTTLTRVYVDLERFTEATASGERALRILEQAVGTDHPELSDCLDALTHAYVAAGRFADAEEAGRRALAIDEKTFGPVHLNVATSLVTLGGVYLQQTRYLEAETLFSRALAIQDKTLPADSATFSNTWSQLGIVYANQGRYAEAEQLLKRAQTVCEQALGPDNYAVADAMLVRGHICFAQSRYDEAERLLLQSRDTFRKILDQDQSAHGVVLHQIAFLYLLQERYAEAEEAARQSVEIMEGAAGIGKLSRSDSLATLAAIYAAQDRYDEAKPLFERALAIIEENLGGDSTASAYILLMQAQALHELGEGRQAERLLDRALVLYERASVSPQERAQCYYTRAQIAWDDGRKSEALADLRRAIELVEEQRGHSSGAELERASMFAEFLEVFEKMVQWQTELGDASEALAAIERSKARSLLDELTRPGVDVQLGRSSFEREQLSRRENELKTRIASLEKQLQVLSRRKDVTRPDLEQERSKLEAELSAARNDLYRHYRDARSSSPVYRNLLNVGSGPPRLSQLQRRLIGDKGLMLVYMIGKQGGYMVSVNADKAEIFSLIVDDDAAKALLVEPGPLTADRLQSILMNDQRTGVLQQMTHPAAAEKITDRLSFLWKTLVPSVHRDALTRGQVGRLIVVPDGPLSLLPFETLVVSAAGRTEYLLDVGPPIIYGPSASVLFNLDGRSSFDPAGNLARVLTVGDPRYAGPSAAQPDAPLSTQLAARSRYGIAGGQLARLPYSGVESRWVSQLFENQGLTVTGLTDEHATEANVRELAPGRHWLHLACHGLVDQAHGNFFGSLALSPGSTESLDSANDGFLTFAEICELDLSSCELAILSACETNYGPEQRGEGVWGLSRGFMVAGARRTLASNWLVDDEAAATLVSYFCSGVAREAGGGDIDYAQSLHQAKRLVRKQEKWKSPYYWATFVLVGPD